MMKVIRFIKKLEVVDRIQSTRAKLFFLSLFFSDERTDVVFVPLEEELNRMVSMDQAEDLDDMVEVTVMKSLNMMMVRIHMLVVEWMMMMNRWKKRQIYQWITNRLSKKLR